MTILSVTFADPTGPSSQYYDVLTNTLQQAFAAWTSHMDAPQGSVTINVTLGGIPSTESAAARADYIIRVGGTSANPLVAPVFGYEVATGRSYASIYTTGSLYIDPSFFTYAFGSSPHAPTGLQVMEHEIGHMLAFDNYAASLGTSPVRTTFESYLNNGLIETFTGPNAMAQYGGPVIMDKATVVHPFVPGQVSVMSYTQQATTIQPLDVAMLRDSGLPMLTDQEVQEHAVARLYLAGLGRGADGSGLLNASSALMHGAKLGDIASGILNSPEYALLYGSNTSDASFVSALYQNVLHRAPDAAGAAVQQNALATGTSRTNLLLAFSESPENRAALEANANVSYGATAEAQVERLYDTAFGRAPDPGGFHAFTGAMLNGLTLQQAAMSFIGSAEFNQRYAAATDKQFVDAFYANTLNRAPDAAGEANFVNALAAGRSKADLMISFSESAEHRANVIAGDMAAGGPIRYMAAHLGSIPILPS